MGMGTRPEFKRLVCINVEVYFPKDLIQKLDQSSIGTFFSEFDGRCWSLLGSRNYFFVSLLFCLPLKPLTSMCRSYVFYIILYVLALPRASLSCTATPWQLHFQCPPRLMWMQLVPFFSFFFCRRWFVPSCNVQLVFVVIWDLQSFPKVLLHVFYHE